MQGQPDVCLILPSLGGGGMQRIFIHLAEAFIEYGMNVDMFVCEPDARFPFDVPDGVRLASLQRHMPAPGVEVPLAPRLLALCADPAGLLHLARPVLLAERTYPELHYLHDLLLWLRVSQPRAVVCGITEMNITAVWASRLARPKPRIVVTEHSLCSSSIGAKRPKRWHKRFLASVIRRTYRFADAIVAVSTGVADDLAAFTGLRREAIRTIYNPIVSPAMARLADQPVDHPWFSPGEPPVVLSAGRLGPQKDYPTLVRAFAHLRQARSARLLILGGHLDPEADERERAALIRLAGELGVAADVCLPGWVANPYAYMARSAVFVLSSQAEGFGNVLVEAMHCGCPVVSADCPTGPREILEGGRYGLLVPPGDHLAMAAAMRTALEQPPDRETLRERARCFSIASQARQYVELLRDLRAR